MAPELSQDILIDIFTIIHSQGLTVDESGFPYHNSLRSFSALRLVGRSWEACARPILYRVFTISSANLKQLKDVADILIRRGDLVRDLIVLDDKSNSQRAGIAKETTEAMGRAIACCTDIKTITIYFAHPPHTFSARNWLEKTAPKLPDAVKILRVKMNREVEQAEMNLSRAIVAFGKNLVELDISGWVTGEEGRRFHLPSRFPHLRKLSVQWGSPEERFLKHILERSYVTQGTPPQALKKVSTIKELSFERVGGLTTQSVYELLQIHNVGKNLTSLHLRFTVFEDAFTEFLDASREVLRILPLCPNLTKFSIRSPTSKQLLQVLPPLLQHLELIIFPFHKRHPNMYAPYDVPIIGSFSQLSEYATSKGGGALRTLTLYHAWREEEEGRQELDEICKGQDIELHVVKQELWY